MTDVESVVAKLKQTQKGKLQYGSNDDKVFNAKTSLHITPFTIRNISKVVYSDDKKRTDVPNYENYFSHERAEKLNDQRPPKNVFKSSKVTKMENTSQYGDLNVSYVTNESILLREVNEEYDLVLKKLSNMRLENMKWNLRKFDIEHDEAVQIIEQNNIIKLAHETKLLQAKENEIGQNANDELEQYLETKRRRKRESEQKVMQAEKHRKDLEMKIKQVQEEKREQLMKKRVLGNLSETAHDILRKVTKLFQSSKEQSNGNIPQDFTILIGQVTKEYSNCSSIVTSGLNNEGQDLDVCIEIVNSCLKRLEQLFKACEDFAETIKQKCLAEEKAKKDEEEQAKQREERRKQEEIKASASVVTTTAPAPVTTENLATNAIAALTSSVIPIASAVPALAPLESTLHALLHMFSTKLAFTEYLRSQKLLLDTMKLIEPLNKSTAKEQKAIKFDLYKVVNTSVNAISDESPKHLLDKIMKLHALLNEQVVEMSGKNISTKSHEHALDLCKELVARKLVMQSVSQVSSSFKAAFPIAAVAVGIWTLFPTWGDLLLAHFFAKCPLLVPFYIPKSKTMSTLDYCKLVGYDVDGEEVEAEDKYLKKLSGIVRLYAAIIQTDVPPQLGDRNHPYGLEHGWVWFTRILNLEPRPSVSATVIYDFLEVAGNAMLKRFGKQFQKLLMILCQEVFPKILEVTPDHSKAGAMRLKLFLNTCITEGSIKEPEGNLSKQWWNTGRS